ncbi:hypothetical protein GCM10025751_18830 [Haladaptatus pallidirubidus]|uniref:Transposase n=1 Tax=Haladaptatus pallidirubidus TaxID=1008152 RepID=A0AAV3UFZ0_9EURY
MADSECVAGNRIFHRVGREHGVWHRDEFVVEGSNARHAERDILDDTFVSRPLDPVADVEPWIGDYENACNEVRCDVAGCEPDRNSQRGRERRGRAENVEPGEVERQQYPCKPDGRAKDAQYRSPNGEIDVSNPERALGQRFQHESAEDVDDGERSDEDRHIPRCTPGFYRAVPRCRATLRMTTEAGRRHLPARLLPMNEAHLRVVALNRLAKP